MGLGNPGPQHAANRHNAGAILLQQLCGIHGTTLRPQSKFFGEMASIQIAGQELKLLFPTTWMNHSGKSVSAVCRFFRIEPEQMLVVYDEIDFDVGVTRFKQGGGHGGHNGLRDIINSLGGSKDFYRLRIGVGHPGHKSMVSGYVLSDPSRSEVETICHTVEKAIQVLPIAMAGDWDAAMKSLHTAEHKICQ